jgi:hypothetical protein
MQNKDGKPIMVFLTAKIESSRFRCAQVSDEFVRAKSSSVTEATLMHECCAAMHVQRVCEKLRNDLAWAVLNKVLAVDIVRTQVHGLRRAAAAAANTPTSELETIWLVAAERTRAQVSAALADELEGFVGTVRAADVAQ